MSRPRSSISARSLEESLPKTTFRRDFNASRASPSFCVCFHAAPVSTAFSWFSPRPAISNLYAKPPEAAYGRRSVCEPKPEKSARRLQVAGLGALGAKSRFSPPGAPADPSKSGRSSWPNTHGLCDKPNPTPACSKADWKHQGRDNSPTIQHRALSLPGRGSSRNCNRCCPKEPCLAGFWV